MTLAADVRSGKGHRNENFPVASRLIQARHRKPIMAFYNFVRTADDVADHASLPQAEKLRLLDSLEATLLGQSDAEPEGVALRAEIRRRSLDPQHARDLLTAFRMDVIKRRYRDWDDLMNYCRYSAMPVGRFVLDVHGEPRSTWPANDALCAALQIINHLQDCADDYRNLDRVYLPLDLLERYGARVEHLKDRAAAPQLRACFNDICARLTLLLKESAVFSAQIADRGLSLEVAVIQRLAERLTRMLRAHDPLSERVHLGPLQVAGVAVLGVVQSASRRLTRPRSIGREANSNEPAADAATAASGSSSMPPCASCRASSARPCTIFMPSAAPSTISPTTAATGKSDSRNWRNGGTTSMRSLPASRRRGLRAWRRPCAPSHLRARTSWP